MHSECLQVLNGAISQREMCLRISKRYDCRSRADEAKQAGALVERVRLLLSGGGTLARQGSARTSRAAHQPQAADAEVASTPDDRCSSDDSWEVVEAYPAAHLVAASPADEEAEVLQLVKGVNFVPVVLRTELINQHFAACLMD